MYKGEEGRKAYEEANSKKSDDQFIGAVEKFRASYPEQKIAELEQETQALKAHINNLRNSFNEALEWNWLDDDAPNISDFIALYDIPPQQSLDTLKAEIENEVIDRCANWIGRNVESLARGENPFLDTENNMPRKYSEDKQ